MEEHVDKPVPFYDVGAWNEFQIDCRIMGAITQLDIQILYFMDGRPEWVYYLAIRQPNSIIKRMPDNTENLHHVRRYECLILRRNASFILDLAASKSSELSEQWAQGDDPTWEGAFALPPGANILSTANLPIPEGEEESLSCRQDVRRFSRSAAPLLDQIRESGSQQEKVIAAIWEINCLAAHIMLAGVLFTWESLWHRFIPEFQKILALAQYCQPYLLAPLKGATLYRFEIGILVALSSIAFRCCHRPTRYATFDLLRSMHYREGVFDSYSVAMIGSWLAGIEEEGINEYGYIPADKRVFLNTIFMDLRNKRALLGCVQRSLEGVVYKKSVITW
jgi:hypothetical protein